MPKKTVVKSIKMRPQSDEGYKTGYRNPPKEHQFKKGQSGNPSGRPKGSKNNPRPLGTDELTDLILREANRKIDVQEHGKTVTLSMAETVMRSLSVKAAKGHDRAQKVFLDTVSKAQQIRKNEEHEYIATMCEYKRKLTEELIERKRSGKTGPEPVPHPDDIVIDPRKGTVEIRGPVTQEEKAILDYLIDREQASREEVEILNHHLDDEWRCDDREMYEAELRDAEEQVEYFQDCIRKLRGERKDEFDLVRAHKDFKEKGILPIHLE